MRERIHSWFVCLQFGVGVRLVKVGVLLDVGEPIHAESVLLVERMSVHGDHSKSSIFRVTKLDEDASDSDRVGVLGSFCRAMNSPFALSLVVVPRDENIFSLDGRTFSREFLRYFREQFFGFGSVDDGDAVHDEDVFE
jgi:hypothetical protein